MSTPPLLRIADNVHYDELRGAVRVCDPHTLAFVAYGDVAEVADALNMLLVLRSALPYLAGYGLALAARAWAERPTDARRAALIQAGEQLHVARADSLEVATFIEQCLAHADAAIFAGENAEMALIAFVGKAVQRADRSAERCGRRAAELLDNDDHVLALGDADAALAWMLFVAATEQQKQFQLSATHPDIIRTAQAAGMIASLLAAEQVAAGCANKQFSVCIVAAAHVALDGSSAVGSAVQRDVALAQQQRIPCYVLAAAGPDPQAATETGLPQGAAILAPDTINAIVTDRGIYRSAMVARYLGDNDAPQDIIPLIT